MPKNSSGVYSQPAGTEAVSGAVASSSDYNTLISDIASTLTGDLPRDGSAPMSSNLPMGGNNIIDMDGAAQRSHGAIGADLADGQFDFYGDQGGGATGSVVNNGFAPATYTDGFQFRARKVTANAGAFTMNVASIGEEPVFKQSASGPIALEGGEMPAGHLSWFEYDSNLDSSNGGWWLLNPHGDFDGKDAGTGLLINGVAVDLALTQLPAIAAAVANGDFVGGVDVSASNQSVRISIQQIFQAIATIPTETEPALDDVIALSDTSISNARGMTLENLAKVLGLSEIETQTPSGTPATLLFDTIPAGRTALVMFLKGLQGDTTTLMNLAQSVNNGSSFVAQTGGSFGVGSAGTTSFSATGGVSQTDGTPLDPSNAGTGDDHFGVIFFPNYSAASTKKWFVGIVIGDNAAGCGVVYGTTDTAVAAVDALRLSWENGAAVFDDVGSATLYSWG